MIIILSRSETSENKDFKISSKTRLIRLRREDQLIKPSAFCRLPSAVCPLPSSTVRN